MLWSYIEMIQKELNWWDKLVIPLRNVWATLSTKIGFRKTGLIKLQKEVRTCEYEDVHIQWDMAKRNEADLAKSRKGHWWKFQWHNAPLCFTVDLHLFLLVLVCARSL